MSSLARQLALAASAAVLAGCSTLTPRLSGDPIEPVNRGVFAFNEAAQALYRSLGFRVVSLNMALPLAVPADGD